MWALGSLTPPSPHPRLCVPGAGAGGSEGARRPSPCSQSPPLTPGGGEAPGDPPLFTEHPPPQGEVRAPGDPPPNPR